MREIQQITRSASVISLAVNYSAVIKKILHESSSQAI